MFPDAPNRVRSPELVERVRDRDTDREILRLAVPALGALLAEPAYLLADTAVVARLGTTPLAGLAVASSVLIAVTAPLMFLAYATTSIVARRLGAGDHTGAGTHAVQAMWLAILLGTVILLGGFLGADTLVGLFGPTPEVASEALTYLRISLLGVPALLLVLAGTGYLRGLQNTRTPLVVMVASATTNLVVELVLIFGFGFGIGASAVGTVVAQWGAGAVFVVMVARGARHHGVSWRPRARALRAVAAISGDLFVRTLALRGAFLTTTLVAARFGTVPLAANEVALAVFFFLAFGLDAVAIAAQSMVGLRVGAGDRSGAHEVIRRLRRWGLVLGVGAGVLLLGLHRALPALLTPDRAVVDELIPLLLALALIQPVAGVAFVLDGVFIGAGEMRYLAKAMVLALLVFLPLAAAVVLLDAGLVWLWAALAAFLLARMVTLLVHDPVPALPG